MLMLNSSLINAETGENLRNAKGVIEYMFMSRERELVVNPKYFEVNLLNEINKLIDVMIESGIALNSEYVRESINIKNIGMAYDMITIVVEWSEKL